MLLDAIKEIALKNAENIALIHDGERVSYKSMFRAIEEKVQIISNLNLSKSEPFGIVLENSFEFIYWLLACFETDHPAILLPTYFRNSEYMYHLNKIGLRYLVAQKQYDKYFEEFNKIRMVGSNGLFFKENITYSSKELFSGDRIIQFTSGSEGQSKAVVRTDKSLENEIISLYKAFEVREEEVFAPIAPMCHSFGLVGGTLFPLYYGYTVLITDTKYPTYTFTNIAKYHATYVFAVPYIYHLWCDIAKKEHLDLTDIQRCYTAGVAMEAEVYVNFKNVTGLDIYQDYGSTEAGTIAIGKVPLLESNSIGEVIGNAELRIDKVKDASTDEHIGELIIKNNILDFRYLYPAELNNLKVIDGFYYTGDMVMSNNNGIFYKFRKDQCINVAGLKVYAYEIEQVLLKLQHINEVAVVPFKDNIKGEGLYAYIVVEHGWSYSENDIRMYCKKNLADYKIPSKVCFVKKLEKNAAGKILKKYMMKVIDINI